MNRQQFVFQDTKGRRWNMARWSAAIIGFIAIATAIVFIRALWIRPELRQPAALKEMKFQLRAAESQADHPWTPALQAKLWERYARTSQPGRPAPPAPQPSSATQGDVVAAFWVGWDPASMLSLARNASRLTHICPDFYTVSDARGTVSANEDPAVIALSRERGLGLVPVLSNLVGEGWETDGVEGMIRGDTGVRESFRSYLIGRLTRIGARGLLIDWQQLDPQYQAELTTFLHELADGLHAHGMELWLSIPMGDDLRVFDLDTLSGFCDRLVAQLHDENSQIDAPGPIASRDWFEGWLGAVLCYGRPDQWIVSLGSYGYDWASDGKHADTISFSDALARAGRAGVAAFGGGAPTFNPYFYYAQGDTDHQVWFLDALTFYNQARAALASGCGGLILNRLGSEDPGIWKLLPPHGSPLVLPKPGRALADLDPGDTITHVGQGDFIEVDTNTDHGSRTISLGSDGYAEALYDRIPRFVTITHTGDSTDRVAITFDDGPDPEFTPKILDILKKKGVKAAFFVVGRRAEDHPELLRRIVAEGHELGSHTFTHPNLSETSDEQTVLELNATQRLIEWITGRSTLLFRPPYNADAHPSNIDEVGPLAIAQGLGYTTVCESVDPEDWEKPGAGVIFDRVKDRRSSGNIVLLHDGGGDRNQTVAALPHIIDYLRARGDKVVPLRDLLGVPEDALMPPIRASDQPMSRVLAGTGIIAMHSLEEFFWACMILATGLVLLRALAVVVLAIIHRLRDDLSLPTPEVGGVSVLIAAYNEEKVIANTLRSVLASDFPGRIEILVIDDGSADATSARVSEIAVADSRVILIRQDNAGKAAALSLGLSHAREEIVVLLDADTHFERRTIPRLLRPLADRDVGAVSGRARVGNTRRLIARFQSLEYTCGFNLDRRAYAICNAITVVPGAISAFRKQAILDAGGIHSSTLAEDTDLTLCLHRDGWRIAYAGDAVAWTEAPETIGALAKQRFRWAFGTMQCLWKHRDLLFNPRFGALGFFSLPSVWFCQIFLVAAAPLVDVLLLFSLFAGGGGPLLIYVIGFLAADLLLTFIACLIEREPLLRAFYILPMHVLYRPLLSYVVWKSIIHSIKGAWVGWGKLDRRGTVVSPGFAKAQTKP